MKILDGFRNMFNKLFPVMGKEVKKVYNELPPDINQREIEYLFDDTSSLERKDNFNLYEEMDNDSPEASSALDYYADMVTQGDDVLMRGHRVTVEAESDDKKKKGPKRETIEANFKALLDAKAFGDYREQAKDIITKFELRTSLKFRLRDMVRDALKYGDNFEQVLWADVEINGKLVRQIIDFHALPITMMALNRDKYNRLIQDKPYLATDEKGDIIAEFAKSQIFRIQTGTTRENLFGKGLFNSGRKTYLRLDAIESGMTIGRLVRSHMRYVHKVDTTGMSQDQGLKYTENYKRLFTKKKIADANGNIKWIKAPLAADEDMFVPVKKDSPADVKVADGSAYLSYIDDVLYLRDKFITALKLTKPNLGSTEGSKNATAELETNPIRFVKSLQNNVRMGLVHIYKLELISNGIPKEIADTINIEMPEISSVAEYRKWSIEKMRAEIAKIYKESGIMDIKHILTDIFYLDDEEADEIIAALEEEKQKEFDQNMELMKAQGAMKAAQSPASKTGNNYPAQRKTTLRTTNKNKQQGKGANARTTPSQSESVGTNENEEIITE